MNPTTEHTDDAERTEGRSRRRSVVRVVGRAALAAAVFALALAASGFVLLLILLHDVGRVADAWGLFFLALDLALLLRLVAWNVRSRRLARAAVFAALLSPAMFPVWAAWNWATFLRYPDIPSEWVLFAHGPYWKVDASGDAVLVSPRPELLCPCDGLTFRPPRCAPLAAPVPPEERFEGEPPRIAATAWAVPVATKALAALSGRAPDGPVGEPGRGAVDAVLDWSPSGEEPAPAETNGAAPWRVPVAWDPLVFHVPAASPVRDLTRERLSDVYHGRVRTWRELGFDDPRAIVPYERERNEAAQTFARAWIAPEPTKFVTIGRPPSKDWTDEDAMDGHLAEFRARPGAIGYSMHVMAAPLVREGTIRLLSVDGAAPTAENIAAGLYPPGRTLELVAADPPSENVRRLAAFLRSPAGRGLLASAGFLLVPLSTDPATP